MDGEGSLFNKTQRQHLMIDIIESDNDDGGAELNLRALEMDDIITKAYPLHENSSKKKLIEEFVKNRKPWTPVPIDEVRRYFGEEIAFYFAWLSFYTKWLLGASAVGFLTSIIGWSGINGEDYWSNTIYSIFIGIWATMFLEFWKRERNVCAWKWNMLDYEEVEGLRPGFSGEEKIGAYAKGEFIPLREDEIYGISPPKPTKSFPIETTRMRMFIGVSFIATLCVVVVIATIAVLTFRILVQNSHSYSGYASVVGGVANAIVIMALNKLYRYVAFKLNDWENHRTNTYYVNNLLFKIFLFQFVNSYTSMYYIAFFKRKTTLWGDPHLKDQCGDPEGEDGSNTFGWGCPDQLYVQLLTILGTNIAVGQAQEVIIPWVLSKLKLYWLQRTTNMEEESIPKHEREYELNQFEGMVDEYGEMVIQYGYLTLFASSVPIAPVLAVFNNVIEMRTDMFKWLTSYNKPFYRGADDIGGWYTILQVLGIAAVITNCLLIFFSFPTLHDVSKSAYDVLWTVVILEHIIFLIKYIVSSVVPDTPTKVRSILAKQYYIQQQLIKKYEHKHMGSESGKLLRRKIEEVEQYGEEL